jgi:ABC-type antimicrobial peptide transport system ATPase subunit
MSKNSIIEQLRAAGAVAAHPMNKWVTIVRGKPQKVAMAHPLFMDKKSLKSGDKIAIVDTSDYSFAFICRVTGAETSGVSKTVTLDVSVIKTIDLSG